MGPDNKRWMGLRVSTTLEKICMNISSVERAEVQLSHWLNFDDISAFRALCLAHPKVAQNFGMSSAVPTNH